MLQTVSADYVKFCHTDLLRSVNSSLRGNSRPFFVMKGMAAMVKGLGAKVVIEGVETGPCLHSARNLGADYMQGYLFGKPDETLISHKEFKGSDLELTFKPRLHKELLNATA
jgi:EAL domain-containing protein (putative c-di-GMP-specific phosphodiesterase class I)